MKTEFKAKFLQHIKQKRQEEEGFTLIELLVVIIIIGILAAIALPNFLNQANRARQTEAQNQLGAINRAQQAFRLENANFASTFADLDIGVATQTDFYQYSVVNAANNVSAMADAEPIDPNGNPDAAMRGYAGALALNLNNQAIRSAVCESDDSNSPAGAINIDTTANNAAGVFANCTQA